MTTELDDDSQDGEVKKLGVIAYEHYFNGDIRATEVNSLREEITAILSIASQNDEVVRNNFV